MNLTTILLMMLGCFAAGNTQEDATKDEVKKLQGTWVRIAVDVDGQKSEDSKDPKEAITLIIKGDKYHDELFKIDPTKSPKHLDVMTVDDKGKPFTLPGIYELKGDVLKVCFPYPFEGKFDQMHKRPTEFGSKKGGNEVLEVYQRQKK